MMTGRHLPSIRGRVGCPSSVLLIAVAGLYRAGIARGEAPSPWAAEAGAAQTAEPAIVYRRIFVPAEKVEAWPRDGEKYLPIESRDFEAWVEAANRAAAEPQSPATISEAEYFARFEGDRLVAGRGKWTIRLRDAAVQPATRFLPLGDVSLVLGGARWQDEPQLPARIGAWGKSDGLADTIGLEVPRSGILEFDWHAPSKPLHDGIEIAWRLPVATSTRVILDLPEGRAPGIDGGVVLASERIGADQPDNVPHRRWELALNSSPGTTLRITDARATPADVAPNSRLHEDVSYRVHQRGLDIVATWQLDESLSERRELVVPLPQGVQLVSATADRRGLTHRVVEGANESTDQAEIELPEHIASRPLQITVSAWHPLILDRPWRLPKLRPSAVLWTSGNIELAIAPELEMRGLTRRDCIETGVGEIGSGAAVPETWRLAAYSPAAELDVTLARRQPEATVWLGSSLAMADPDVSGRLVTRWKVAHDSLFNLSGELDKDWVVEAVETLPAEALGEWFIDRRDGRKHIEIQLAGAADPARDVTVIISGRLQRSRLDAPIVGKTMRMVHWHGARVAQHFLTFEATEPYAVESVGELPIVPRDTIGDAERALLDADAADDTIFDLTNADDRVGLKLTLKRGQYDADIRLDDGYVGQELRQTHRLAIRPTANRVDRVLVYSTAPLGDVQWTEPRSAAPLFAERLAADDPLMTGLPAGGELWRVSLSRPTSQPFEITAIVAMPWSRRKQAPLLAMPDAIEQHGRVLVRGKIDVMPRLEPHGLQPTPLPADVNETHEINDLPIRAAYRFNPADCLDRAQSPQLWIGPNSARGTSPVIARRLELESFYRSDGEATHRAIYSLDNEGAAEFEFRLPADAALKSVSIDGRGVEQAIAGKSGEPFLIHLPAGVGSTTVSVSFDTHQVPLAAGGKLRPPLEKSDLPLLGGEWIIWLPDEFSATGASIAASEDLNWRQRLFGPLGRPNRARPFQPLSTADWTRLLGSVFATRTDDAPSSGDRLGWRAFHIPFIADLPVPVVVAHLPATTAWAISIFMLCFASGRWVRRRRGELFVALLAAAAGLSLLLPAVFAPLATGAVLGLLLSLMTAWPRKVISEGDVSLGWSRLSTVSAPVLALTFLAAKGAWAEPAADSDLPATASRPAAIHRLLIPATPDGRPAGSKYYVSEQFLRELLRSDTEGGAAERQWLIVDAAYSGELRERAEPRGIVAGDWTMTLAIEVLARDTTIMLPLVRDEAAWPATALLDGVPTPLIWREDGRSCAIAIAEPGRYSLAISCVPRTTDAEGRSLVKLSIPPVRGARLQLNSPRNATALTVSGVNVSHGENDSSNVLESEIDAAGQIDVQWTRSETIANGGQALRVTGMRWLRIGVDQINLDAKFVVEGKARRPEAFVVAFDRDWQLVRDDLPADWRVEVDPEGRGVIRIPLASDDSARQEVTLRWRLTGAASLGRLRLPPIELKSIPVTQRWLAISTAPTLECVIADGSASPGSVNEFLAMWGTAGAADVPQMVLEDIEARQAWSTSLAIRPRQTESVIDEMLHVAAGNDLVRVAYQADVVPDIEHRYRFSLEVPADLSIEEIVLMQADRRIPLRWARTADNRVNVFFGEEVSAEYRLLLIGNTPVAKNGTCPLPRVVAAAAAPTVQRVQLYREETVLVEVRGLSDADESPDAPLELPPTPWTAHPIGAYRLDKRAADIATLVITANSVRLAGDTLTTLTRGADAWWAAFQCRAVVEDGVLDALRIRAPATWAGPFTLESTVPASIEILSAEKQPPMLSLRFAESVATGETVELSIRGPLATAASSTVSVPDIVPEQLTRWHRFAAVPASLEGQSIEWSEVGTAPAEFPKTWQPPGALAEMRTFEIVSSPFQVALQPRTGELPSARVRLADTTVWSDTANSDAMGGQLIVTRLVVESHGLPECTLRLPPNHELVAVQLDARPAMIRRSDAANWQVPLGAAQLPSVLEIVTTSHEPFSGRRRVELRRPVLLARGESVPVEMSLWSLGSPRKMGRPRFEGASAATAVNQAVSRFDRLLSIAEAATPAAAELPVPDGWNWFRPWAALLANERQQALDTVAKSVDRRAVSRVSRPAEEQLTQASSRFDEWLERCDEVLASPDLGVAPTTPEERPAARPLSNIADQWTYCSAEGGADRLIVGMDGASAASSQVRIAGLIAIISLTAASLFLMRLPAAWDLLYRWPHAAGFLAGLGFWAWLWPSWLGLSIAAASLFLAWRPGWPGRLVRMEGSTVLRAGGPSG